MGSGQKYYYYGNTSRSDRKTTQSDGNYGRNFSNVPYKDRPSTGYSKGRSYYDDYDDDERTYYKPTYKPWSWDNWNNDRKEDAGDLYIKDSESYFTPTKSELRIRLHDDQLQDAQELCRFFYFKMIGDKDYVASKYADKLSLKPSQLEIVTTKEAVYEKLWKTDIPGMSPKEQAIYVLTQANTGKRKAKIMDLRDDAIERIRICKDDMWDPIYNELLDEVKDKNMSKFGILQKLSLIKNFGSKFKIEKEIEEKVVANSHLHARKMMRDYSQIYNVELYQRMFPNFNHKLATKDLLVHVPVDKTEHKQKIIMLVDYSG